MEPMRIRRRWRRRRCLRLLLRRHLLRRLRHRRRLRRSLDYALMVWTAAPSTQEAHPCRAPTSQHSPLLALPIPSRGLLARSRAARVRFPLLAPRASWSWKALSRATTTLLPGCTQYSHIRCHSPCHRRHRARLRRSSDEPSRVISMGDSSRTLQPSWAQGRSWAASPRRHLCPATAASCIPL